MQEFNLTRMTSKIYSYIIYKINKATNDKPGKILFITKLIIFSLPVKKREEMVFVKYK